MSTKKCSCRDKEYIKIFCDGTRREESDADIKGADTDRALYDADIKGTDTDVDLYDEDVPLDLSIGSKTAISDEKTKLSDVQTNLYNWQTKYSGRSNKLSGRQTMLNIRNIEKSARKERQMKLSERKMKLKKKNQEKMLHPLLRHINNLLDDPLDLQNTLLSERQTPENKVAVFSVPEWNCQRTPSPSTESTTAQFDWRDSNSNNNNNRMTYLDRRGYLSSDSEDRESSPPFYGPPTTSPYPWYPGLNIVVNDVHDLSIMKPYISGIKTDFNPWMHARGLPN